MPWLGAFTEELAVRLSKLQALGGRAAVEAALDRETIFNAITV